MRAPVSFAVSVALSVTAIPAAAADLDELTGALRLRPVSGWTADFADDSCALRRTFSDGQHTVAFEMLQHVPNTWADVTVVSSSLKFRPRKVRAGFIPNSDLEGPPIFRSFSTDDGESGLSMISSHLETVDADGKMGVELIWPEADRDRREKEIAGYFVGGAFERDVVLESGPLHEPMKVMRTCLDDLIVGWGLAAAVHRSQTRKVELSVGDAFWPALARRVRGLLGDASNRMFRARLLIDAKGEQTACKIVLRSGDEENDQKICEALRREAEFRPALDQVGQPFPSYYLFDFAAVSARR